MANINVFTTATGINNKIDPVRIRFKDGISDLAKAINVDIDPSGRITRRAGYQLRASGNYNSLYKYKDFMYVVKNNYLGMLHNDYSFTPIVKIQNTEKISYIDIENTLYFANGFQNGKIIDKTYYDWVASDYVGPETTKTFSSPPIGNLLELYNGRMFIAQEIAENYILWFSQPFAYNWYDLERNFFLFNSPITMLKAVSDGLYIGTTTETYFLSGAYPEEFSLKVVSSSGVIRNSAVRYMAYKTPYREILFDKVIFWGSPEGIFIGGNSGKIFNITFDRIVYPKINSGTGFIHNNKYHLIMRG